MHTHIYMHIHVYIYIWCWDINLLKALNQLQKQVRKKEMPAHQQVSSAQPVPARLGSGSFRLGPGLAQLGSARPRFGSARPSLSPAQLGPALARPGLSSARPKLCSARLGLVLVISFMCVFFSQKYRGPLCTEFVVNKNVFFKKLLGNSTCC
jgi:hypothetical protein